MSVFALALAAALAATAAPAPRNAPDKQVLLGDMSRRAQSLAGQQTSVLLQFSSELAALRARARSARLGQLAAVDAEFRSWERRLDAYLAGSVGHAVVASRPSAGRAPTAEEAREYNRPKLQPRALRHSAGVAPRFGAVADGSGALPDYKGEAAVAAASAPRVPLPPRRPRLYPGESRDLRLDVIVVPAAAPLPPAVDKPTLAGVLVKRWGRRTIPTIKAAMVRASEHGVNHYLLAAIIERESTGRYWVKSKAREPARGAMQVKPSTAREVGVRGNLYDPMTGIEAGIRRLKQMYAKFGDIQLALAHYYSGPNSKRPNLRYAREVLERAAEIRRAAGIWV